MTMVDTASSIRFWQPEHAHPRAALFGTIVGAVVSVALSALFCRWALSLVFVVRSPRLLLALCAVYFSLPYLLAALTDLVVYTDRVGRPFERFAERFSAGRETAEHRRFIRSVRAMGRT